MRKVLLFLLFIIVFIVKSNAQGIVDSIALKTCECVDGIKSNASKDEFYMKFGVCILEKSKPYEAELKRNYKIDFNKANVGKKLGELIGLKMAYYCPETILKLSQEQELPASSQKKEEFFSVEGKITDIQSEQFLTIKIQTGEGKIYSVLWLYFFDNSATLMKDKAELVGKKIKVNFTELELYDAKAKEYRKFKVIKELELE